MKLRVAFVTVVVALVAACTGGSSTPDESGGGPNTGGSSGAASSSGNGGSSSGSDVSACTEVHIGATNDPLGGSAESQVIAQSVADLGGVAIKELADLTTSCKALASGLDVSPSDQASADGAADARTKAKAWCALAVKQLGTTKATAGGTLGITHAPAECRLSIQAKTSCQEKCNGAPCDVAANPVTCSGGKIESGACVGGELGGGCKAEAKCDASCNASILAFADCPAPTVTVTSSGASDAAAAAKIEAALETSLPKLLVLRAHSELETGIAGSFSGNVSAVTDIKPACIPKLVSAAANAVNDIKVVAEGSASVVGGVE